MSKRFDRKLAPRSARLVAAMALTAALLPFAAPHGAEAAQAGPAEAAHAERIVAVGGAVTETLYALHAEDRIVAVDTTAVYPPEAAAKPSVGYMRALSAEGVLAMSPDLVLLEEGSGPPAAIDLLKASGVTIVNVPAGHGVEAIGRKIETIAAAVGKETAGAHLAETVEAKLGRLETRLSELGERKRVLFVLSIVDGRPMAAGSGTAADAMIRLAGGTNVFAEVKGYKTLSPEAAAELAPDVVLMMSGAGPEHAAADPFALPALAATPAGREKALVRMDAGYLLGFGPRTADAARDLAARLYPGRIEPAP
ncbi:heme/hemin ABC transporter substrate-binding protein [Jiella sonneratiae]|uniref:ABC transporter substrate-binding protein n=1 Tax=Jiella sonneratiae TaxID=2816856 RepID=A0ABS3J1T1_9HYPH|nr:ABC transporter substrate-binding protein [Jiella sonneratiae]MBO0902933.1 ABC transporter substrate-binding protein [Jiella sonneratiae]